MKELNSKNIPFIKPILDGNTFTIEFKQMENSARW